jgi:hypothetical protein
MSRAGRARTFRRTAIVTMALLIATIPARAGQAPGPAPQVPPPGPIEGGLNVDPNAPASLRTAVNACLADYWTGGPTLMELVQELNAARAYILIRPVSESPKKDNGTYPVPMQADGVPRYIVYWDPTDTRPYKLDDIPRVPCATLLHELKHVDDLIHGVIHDVQRDARIAEPRAVQVENLYAWRHNLPQRRYYYPWPDPLPTWVLWGTARQETPPQPTPEPPRASPAPSAGTNLLTLTVINETPDLILIAGRNQGELLCGGQNPYFRARTTARACTLQVLNNPSRNPFEVPLVTLVAYFPSGDPKFPRRGRVTWSDDQGQPINCGGNAYSEYCQIAMGERGSYTGGERRDARPASRTIKVRYEVSGVATRELGAAPPTRQQSSH